MGKFVDFDRNGMLTVNQCAKICSKTPQTIRRYEREGWPAPYYSLCELHASGRVMPLKWRYVRFNTNGLLQMDNGEIAESDILNIAHTHILLDQQRYIIDRRGKEIERLKSLVNSLTADAANDHFA